MRKQRNSMFFLMQSPETGGKKNNNIYVSSGLLRSRCQYGIRCPRDLLGKTPMKENGERIGREPERTGKVITL